MPTQGSLPESAAGTPMAEALPRTLGLMQRAERLVLKGVRGLLRTMIKGLAFLRRDKD